VSAPVAALCEPRPPLRYFGCGHPLKAHTEGLRCRVCGAECGVDARPVRTIVWPAESVEPW